ncbi:MAG TPA: elongation factor P maturation arginine rhamnosyltransferase EarP, partial [Burkholderiaceae bacterium]
PQRDGAHVRKLRAFVDRFAAAAGALPGTALALWQAWNGLAPWDAGAAAALDEGALARWRAAAARWRDHLAAQSDLVTQLLHFVAGKR